MSQDQRLPDSGGGARWTRLDGAITVIADPAAWRLLLISGICLPPSSFHHHQPQPTANRHFSFEAQHLSSHIPFRVYVWQPRHIHSSLNSIYAWPPRVFTRHRFATMRPFALLVAALAVVPGAVAVGAKKSAIVWFENESTPDHIIDQAKEALLEAGGKITHVYSIIK